METLIHVCPTDSSRSSYTAILSLTHLIYNSIITLSEAIRFPSYQIYIYKYLVVSVLFLPFKHFL